MTIAPEWGWLGLGDPKQVTPGPPADVPVTPIPSLEPEKETTAPEWGWLSKPADEARSTNRARVAAASEQAKPDEFAKQRDIAKAADLPVEVVKDNEAELAASLYAQTAGGLLDVAPVTAEWFGRSDENAKLASDSVKNLSVIETIIGSFRSFGAGVINEPASWSKGAGALWEVTGRAVGRPIISLLDSIGLNDVSAALQAPLPEWTAPIQPGKVLAAPGNVLEAAADAVKPPSEQQNYITDVAGGLGQVSAQITALILSGGWTSAMRGLLLLSGANQTAKDVKAEGEEGTVGGDLATIGGAAVTGITEKFGLNMLLDKIPAAVRSRVGRMLAGASTEAVQEISEQVMNNLIAIATYDPNQSVFDSDTLYEGGVGAGVGTVVGAVVPGRRAVQAKRNLEDLAKEINGSPLTERAPDVAAEHVAENLKAAGVEVYIPVEALDKLGADFEALGIDPMEADFARARGGDIKLPEERFVALATDEALFEGVIDHVRVGAAEMNVAEVDAQKEDRSQKEPEEKPAAEEKPAEGTRDTEAPAASPEADAAVTQAQERVALKGLFETGREAGMAKPAYEAYVAKVEEARRAALERVEARLLREQKAKLTAEWKAEEDTTRSAVEQEVSNRPVYQAFDAIGAVRLDREATVALLSQEMTDGVYDPKVNPEVLDLLPKQDKGRSIVAGKSEKGVHPDVLAQQHGFADGIDMLRALVNMEPKKDIVARETEERMQRKHGHIMNELQATEAAIEAMHNSRQADVLVEELNALRNSGVDPDLQAREDEGRAKKGSAKAERGRFDRAVFQRAAAEGLAQTKVGQISTTAFLREETRKGQDAGRAIRKGQRSKALRAKFQQLLNFEYARQSYGILRAVEKQRKEMAKLVRPRKEHRNIDSNHLDQIRELLAGYNLSAPLSHEKRVELIKAAKERAEATGEPMRMPPEVVRDANTVHYRDMTLGQWNALYERVKQIETQGRKWKKFQMAGRELDFQQVKEELIAQAETLPTIARQERLKENQNPGMTDRARATLGALSAFVGKVELMARRLDGGKAAGVWHRAIFQPIADAQTAELDMFKTVMEPLLANLKKLPAEARKRLDTKFHVPELGRKMTGSDLLMLALNMGNDSNAKKVIEGSEKDNGAMAWTEEGVAEALRRLGPEEAAWVQSVWDAFEKLRPKVEAIYKSEHGIPPERIMPREVEIGGVKVKGGYFPMMYDPNRAPSHDRVSTLELLSDPLIRGSVFSGMTKARAPEYSAPVLLNLNQLGHALRHHVHFITHYEPVRDVRKVIDDKEIATTVRNKLGPEAHDEFQGWLEAVATNGADRTTSKGVNNIFQMMRANLTAAILGFSYTTGVSQLFGLSTSAAAIGAKWVAVGLDHYAANPAAATRAARELSGEIRHRMGNLDREVSHALGRVTGKAGLWATQQRASLMMIAGIQFYTVDMPTWLGAFNKAQAEGRSDADAVLYADSILRTSQASGHIKDLSAIQRKKGVWQAVTMFSTYTTLLFNLVVEEGHRARKVKNLPGVIARMGWLVALPAVMEAFMRAEHPEEDDEDQMEWWALRTTKYALQSVPVVGRGVGALMDGYPATIAAAEGLGQQWARAFKAVMKAADEDAEFNLKDAKALMASFGQTFGLGGTNQIVRVLDALEADSDEPYEFLIGHREKR